MGRDDRSANATTFKIKLAGSRQAALKQEA
jgi:hypothetical protein